MSWLSYITPLELIKIKSPINGEIKVIESLGKRTLYTNNLEQSGGTITGMWDKSISKIKNQISKTKNCLVLGLGGGTVVELLNKYRPTLKITAVEFDPAMIEIAQKYFDIKNSPNLEIIHADAIKWVKKAKNKYDLIIFDLYLGKFNPEKTRKVSFLKDLKNLLNPKGIILYNSHYQNDDLKFERLKKICSEIFIHNKLILKDRYSRILLLGRTRK